jgi:hypothetical protein
LGALFLIVQNPPKWALDFGYYWPLNFKFWSVIFGGKNPC